MHSLVTSSDSSIKVEELLLLLLDHGIIQMVAMLHVSREILVCLMLMIKIGGMVTVGVLGTAESETKNIYETLVRKFY